MDGRRKCPGEGDSEGNGDEGGEVLAGDGAVGIGCQKEKKMVLGGEEEKNKIGSQGVGGGGCLGEGGAKIQKPGGGRLLG